MSNIKAPSPLLPVLPPLPGGIVIPSTVEELLAHEEEPIWIWIILYRTKGRRWMGRVREEIAREKMRIPRFPKPGEMVTGRCTFKGPLKTPDEIVGIIKGAEHKVVFDQPRVFRDLGSCDRFEFTLRLFG